MEVDLPGLAVDAEVVPEPVQYVDDGERFEDAPTDGIGL
jgi:hypothetical protein